MPDIVFIASIFALQFCFSNCNYLYVSDYYWTVESPYQWIQTLFSNDCAFMDYFIEFQLLPMHLDLSLSSLSNYNFTCNESITPVESALHVCSNNLLGQCVAYQHFMFEINTKYNAKNTNFKDTTIGSVLNRTFIHYTLLYNATYKPSSDNTLTLISFISSANTYTYINSIFGDYKSYLTNQTLISTEIAFDIGVDSDEAQQYDIEVDMEILSDYCNFIYVENETTTFSRLLSSYPLDDRSTNAPLNNNNTVKIA